MLLINLLPTGFRQGEEAKVIGLQEHFNRVWYKIKYDDGVEDLVDMKEIHSYDLFSEPEGIFYGTD